MKSRERTRGKEGFLVNLRLLPHAAAHFMHIYAYVLEMHVKLYVYTNIC